MATPRGGGPRTPNQKRVQDSLPLWSRVGDITTNKDTTTNNNTPNKDNKDNTPNSNKENSSPREEKGGEGVVLVREESGGIERPKTPTQRRIEETIALWASREDPLPATSPKRGFLPLLRKSREKAYPASDNNFTHIVSEINEITQNQSKDINDIIDHNKDNKDNVATIEVTPNNKDNKDNKTNRIGRAHV